MRTRLLTESRFRACLPHSGRWPLYFRQIIQHCHCPRHWTYPVIFNMGLNHIFLFLYRELWRDIMIGNYDITHNIALIPVAMFKRVLFFFWELWNLYLIKWKSCYCRRYLNVKATFSFLGFFWFQRKVRGYVYKFEVKVVSLLIT